MRTRRIGSALLVLCAAVLDGCGGKDDATAGGPVIGVTLMTQTNDFFKDMEDGMREEAKKRGVRLVVQSAQNDPAAQARQLEDFVAQKVDAVVVVPCNSDTIAASLRIVTEAKIPIFTADIAAKGAKVVTHVSSDNVQGGRLAGEAMGRLLGGKGNVLIIDHPTVSSVQDRTRGFEDALKKFPGVTIVARLSAEGQRSKAQAVMEDALTTHPDLAGVFGINDNSALGALRAVEAAGKTGIVIIGYDATPEAQAAIKRGSALKASVIQYPRRIGAKVIESAYASIHAADLPAIQPVDVGLVDATTLGGSGSGDSK
jgi:ribose transport system substrate-binding protein